MNRVAQTEVKMTIVYSETVQRDRWDGDEEPDSVFVEIRRYSHLPGVTGGDVIMKMCVIVDEEEAVNSHRFISPVTSDAELQRIGIQQFDELLAAHPYIKAKE